MATICIFTPTYNRAHTLPRLFESLMAQTCKDFIWRIVDDGSTDNTQELIASFQAQASFPIDYVWVPNGGKPRAINKGVERSSEELFFIIDSDDYAVPTAVEWALDNWKQLKNEPDVWGILALCGKTPSKPLREHLPQDVSRLHYWDLSERYGFTSDVVLIMRTDLLREHPYEIAEGERFHPVETYAYYLIDEKYLLACDDRIYTVVEYQVGGLSDTFVQTVKDSPIGYMRHKHLCAKLSKTFIRKYKETALYLVGCMLSHTSGAIANAPSPAIAVLAYPAALVLRYTTFR